MIRIRLSSVWTMFYKIVFPAIWIGGFGAGTIALCVINVQTHAAGTPLATMRLMFILSWILGSSFILWFALRLRTVWRDGDCLVVRNYRTEVRIPMSAVRRVKETRMWNPKMIVLDIDPTGNLPEKVVFVAQFAFQLPFSSHPTVKQLLDLAEKAREKTERSDYSPSAPTSDIRW